MSRMGELGSEARLGALLANLSMVAAEISGSSEAGVLETTHGRPHPFVDVVELGLVRV